MLSRGMTGPDLCFRKPSLGDIEWAGTVAKGQREGNGVWGRFGGKMDRSLSFLSHYFGPSYFSTQTPRSPGDGGLPSPSSVLGAAFCIH